MVEGSRFSRLQSKAFNLDDEADFNRFARGEAVKIPVPGSDRQVDYDPCKRIGVMISKQGASRSVALGAYVYECKNKYAMNTNCLITPVLTLLTGLLVVSCSPVKEEKAVAENLSQYVEPRIGTAHCRWFHFTPGAMPFGMAKPAPSTNAPLGIQGGEELRLGSNRL